MFLLRGRHKRCRPTARQGHEKPSESSVERHEGTRITPPASVFISNPSARRAYEGTESDLLGGVRVCISNVLRFALTFAPPSLLPPHSITCDFWDTAGQERFNSLHPSYYFGAHICVLVFDVTRKQTYKQLTEWYRELREYCENIPCILVANKIDVDYNVTKKNFKFGEQHNIPFFFCSAADGTNVVKIFDEAIREGQCYKTSGKKDFVEECLELFDNSPLGEAKEEETKN